MAAEYAWLKVGVRADTSPMEKTIRTAATRTGNDAGSSFNTTFAKRTGGFASGLGKTLKRTAIGIGAGAVAAGAAITPMFKTGMAAQDEWLKQQANLQAGLKSTHNAANTSVKGMQDLASSISGYSGQSGLAIQNAEQLLLTFPQIRNEAGRNNDIFNQTTEAVADMAQRLGKDAPSSAIMLGKALNDPIKGVGALRRVGVQLNDQQTKQVKNFVESGNTMQAQKIILGELNKEFGGSAKMYGQTLPGQIKILQNSFKGAERQMVADLEPAMTDIVGTVTKDVLPAFQNFTSQLGPALAPVLKTAAGLISNLAPLFGTVIQQIVPIIGQLAQVFMPLIRGLSPIARLIAQTFGSVFVNLLKSAMPFVRSLAGAFTDFAKQLGPVMPQLATFVTSIGKLLIDALMALMPLLRGGLVVALQLVSAALLVINPVLQLLIGLFNNPAFRVIATVIGAIALAWWGLNAAAAAFLANPMGAVIAAIVIAIVGLVAGIRLLVKNWTTIWNAMKKVVQVVWHGIQAAIQWAWRNVIQPVWNAIKKAINVMAGVFRWLWHKVIEPVWNGIKKAISLYWNYYIHPIFKAIMAVIRVAAGVFRWLWHKVIQPVWNGIKHAISVVWDWIKRWVFTPIHKAIDQLGNVFRWLWHKVIQPVWNGIKGAINTVWGFIRDRIFAPIHAAINRLRDAFTWLWHKVIQPVWDGIKNAINTVWGFIRDKVFGAIHTGISKIGDLFRGMKDTIKNVWDKIKDIVAVPVRFVAFSIINPLIKGANFLLDKIGLHIPLIPKFAEGGRVPGGWGGGDRQPILAEAGEWVLTKRQARAIGYDRLRALPRYAEGGLVGGGEPPMPPGARWWGEGVLHNVVSTITTPFKDLAHMGAEVWNKATHLFRYAAAKAFEALTTPLRKLAEPLAAKPVPPDLFWHTVGKLMLDMISKTVDFIWGKSEDSPEGADIAGEIAQRAVEVAAKQIGKPYIYGSHGPGSFDCSGLMEYSYRMAGYPKGKIPGPVNAIGGYTGTQVQHGRQVNENSALPGDLVFFFRPGNWPKDPHHVAMATSTREVIQAPDVGMKVQRSSPFAAAGMAGDRRMVRRLVQEQVGAALSAVTPGAFGVFSALRSIGYSAQQAAGICGNMAYESSFNPFIIQGGGTSKDPRAAGSGGYGLVQWTPGSKLAEILAWGHKDNTLANQIWALNEQLHGRSPYPESDAGSKLSHARNPFQAGLIFGNEYERFSTDTSYGRAAQARIFFDKFRNRGKFDQGGWLPPGTTLVNNLTRKPEPVLTNRQWDALTAERGQRGGPQYIAGGTLDIGIDTQGRMRAWVQDMVLDEADYAGSYDRMGGGNW